MQYYTLFQKFFPIFRRKRMRWFTDEMKPTAATRILDVGGFPGDWKAYPVPGRRTVLNLNQVHQVNSEESGVEFVVGDGRRMDYADRAFDIVYSNSVIEHLSSFEDQARFAQEVSRVGDGVWVQTPARCFFLEPHYLTPFIHCFPKTLRKKLVRYFTVWGWFTRPSRQQAEEIVNEIRLLNHREMRTLFPDCCILKERFFGLTKSYIAIRRQASL